jgi:16S rRNA (cytosine967-C5)-methyltransferase
MAGPDHRSVALSILDRVRTRELLATAALRHEQERYDLPPEVQAAAHRVALGVLRERRYLDSRLEELVDRGLPRKDKRLLDILRLALYELLFMDGIPPYATVSRYVELARRTKGGKVAGFTNALLRRAAVLDPAGEREARTALPVAVRLSLPDWLYEAAGRSFGDSWEAELERLHDPAAIALRCAQGQDRGALFQELQEEGLAPRPFPENRAGFYLSPGSSPFQTLAFAQRRFRPQDRASQLVTDIVIAAGSGALLDGCAGSGTKSLAFAESGAFAEVVAADRAERKLAQLQARTTAPVTSAVADLTRPPFPAARFDTVFLDAPCTGVGTLRRHPELKWRRTPADAAANAALQGALLDGVAPLVRPGGLLAYAVCSFLVEEGPAVVAAFLARNPQYRLAPFADRLEGTARELAGRMAAQAAALPGYAPGTLLTFPTVLDGDVFFLALLRRAE